MKKTYMFVILIKLTFIEGVREICKITKHTNMYCKCDKCYKGKNTESFEIV